MTCAVRVARLFFMAGASPASVSPIAAQILGVRASLHTAVESLERSVEFGNEMLPVADAAALVVEQITELKRLLALLEDDNATRGIGTKRPSGVRSPRAPAT
jgi:hypothetical protein